MHTASACVDARATHLPAASLARAAPGTAAAAQRQAPVAGQSLSSVVQAVADVCVRGRVGQLQGGAAGPRAAPCRARDACCCECVTVCCGGRRKPYITSPTTRRNTHTLHELCFAQRPQVGHARQPRTQQRAAHAGRQRQRHGALAGLRAGVAAADRGSAGGCGGGACGGGRHRARVLLLRASHPPQLAASTARRAMRACVLCAAAAAVAAAASCSAACVPCCNWCGGKQARLRVHAGARTVGWRRRRARTRGCA
jgi:hypothetical protein